MSRGDALSQHRLNRNQARKLLQQVIKLYKAGVGTINIRHHAKQRRAERNMDFQDVMNTLQGGKILQDPSIHPKTGNFVY